MDRNREIDRKEGPAKRGLLDSEEVILIMKTQYGYAINGGTKIWVTNI